MKIFLSILLIIMAGSGCALHYDLTLYNGDKIRATTKPTLNERGCYVFEIGPGQEVQINRGRVRKIEAVNKGAPPSKSFD